MNKKILGLDLGTNSIGWALIEQDFENKKGNILGMGSRIIPMGQDVLSDFGKGVTKSQTEARTKARSIRRLYQRDNLRRERLHRVLNILEFLPSHYKNAIDFEFHKGQFINHGEPKLPYFKNEQGKYEFLFKDSFNEMVEEFKIFQPDLLYTKANGKETTIPYDWTIYYLRKKALTKRISKEELAWLILNFNQKRGYYQLSEEEQETDDGKNKEFLILKVQKVLDSGESLKKTGEKLYDIYFDNGWKYDKQTTKPQDWIEKTREFIVTSSELKNGEVKRTYKAVDSEQDWIAIKKKTEQEISKSGKTVGTYIYEALLANPTQKIRGKLVRTIERKFYKAELSKILKKQIELHTDLQSKDLYTACILELYPNNEAHRKNIENRDFLYLFMDDIIFYQRPLKTKTHLISDCTLEYRVRKDTKEKIHLKCIAKSNPLFQEFRLWQFLANLKIYERERDGNFDVDVTGLLLSTEVKWVELFEWLNDRDKVNQKQLLAYFKKKEDKFRWNYVEDKEYPCNETRASFLIRIKKLNIDNSFLTSESTQHLWHLLYSVTDPEERKSAVRKFASKHNLSEDFNSLFEKYPPFKRDYGSFSEKAIKKLLPLMRIGKYWFWDNIEKSTKSRIEKLQTAEFDEKIQNRVREKSIRLQKNEDFKGLPLWLASYIVYDKHSEASDTKKWTTSQDIADFLNPNLKGSFKQHSLRNPIVEQVLTETLRVVKDIWDEYGNGEEGYFDEIHIELGREMKNDNKTRERISKIQNENENTNLRIRAILHELLNDGIDVKPYSPSQQEILKIYEEGVYQNPNAKFDKLSEDDISKIRKNSSPSKSEIQRYKLWLEQGYISPYTGNSIMLSDLFTYKYQIEHIFPQSRYFDDSLSNKIICEAEVNQLKDNRTAYEFIKEFGGTTIDLGQGKNVKVFSIPDYEQHVKMYFAKNKTKRENLLSEDIPESFINRQLNDSRYISKVVKNLLSKIVREDDEKEVTSKNIVPVTGSITSQMRQDWGLNDVWNEIIAPRFKRMNDLTQSNDFGEINPNTNKFLAKVPDSLLKGFSKKRIDHRHHALDALVIACVTKDHINYITSINTKRDNFSLVKKLRRSEEIERDKRHPDGTIKRVKQNVAKEFHKPWDSFTQDTRAKLETTVVSFKQNTRVINKTKNKYWKWVKENGQLKKKLVPQTKGDNWAVRKSLHEETVSGLVKLPWIELKKGEITTSTRKSLDTSFNISKIEKITDTGIQKILKNFLIQEKFKELNHKGEQIYNYETAFSPEGIEELNQNIERYNNGKKHKPIIKFRTYEKGSGRFTLGEKGNKTSKYVQGAPNLFFAVYVNKKTKERMFETVPLNEIIEHQKQQEIENVDENLWTPVAVKSTLEYRGKEVEVEYLFTLSPNDLVYVPTQEEIENPRLLNLNNLSKEQTNRIYKMEKSSGSECYFIRNDIASLIKQYDAKSKFGELSSQNKLETTMDSDTIRIKEVCWKLKVGRLGNISKVLF
ncbi:MAG: type II CRISPR RNA-guided endonuclease Cas9 [Flavobacteriales bacterium]|nr:type II CRISPR RNA-guided endonuclease Cas9 [Flavobacteriales bacterium]